MNDRIEILGCPVDVVDMEQAVEKIGQAVGSRKPWQVITANSEILYAAQGDPDLFLALQDAGLVTADGMGVVLASRWLGSPLPMRVAGYDLLHVLAARAAKAGWRLFLLGAKPEVVEAAATRLCDLYPGLQVAGWRDGYFGESETQDVLREVERSHADILLVALGAPRQEKWLHQNLGRCNVPVGIGVGGSFDVLAGTVQRAPLWMQRAGLEWFYRLARQPQRFFRMLALPKFLWLASRQALRQRSRMG